MDIVIYISFGLALLGCFSWVIVGCVRLLALRCRRRAAHRTNDAEKAVFREAAAAHEKNMLRAAGRPLGNAFEVAAVAPRLKGVRKDCVESWSNQNRGGGYRQRLVVLATQSLRRLSYFRRKAGGEALAADRDEVWRSV